VGVLSELNLETGRTNSVYRIVQVVTSSKVGSWLFSRTLYPVDRALFKVTRGRLTVPSLLAGLPVVMLTTTGARTKKRRNMPILGIPVGGDIAVIGSNFGQKNTPGWVYNLEADSSAVVGYRERTVGVLARPAIGAEIDRVFDLASAIYPGFAKYRIRADHRVIRVFVLEVAGPGIVNS
jgi:deazaflavin-dependent oxidoreductase (nitroreductase family)